MEKKWQEKISRALTLQDPDDQAEGGYGIKRAIIKVEEVDEYSFNVELQTFADGTGYHSDGKLSFKMTRSELNTLVRMLSAFNTKETAS